MRQEDGRRISSAARFFLIGLMAHFVLTGAGACPGHALNISV